jgi:hypothetical protein
MNLQSSAYLLLDQNLNDFQVVSHLLASAATFGVMADLSWLSLVSGANLQEGSACSSLAPPAVASLQQKHKRHEIDSIAIFNSI